MRRFGVLSNLVFFSDENRKLESVVNVAIK